MRKKYIEPEPLSLTPEKIKQIKSELEILERKLMPSIRKRLADAYEDGDMPENNPWLTANDDLQSALKKRNELRHLLARAKTFEKQRKRGDLPISAIGNTHKISINNGAAIEVMIVASEESDPVNNKISVDSPLGKALAMNVASVFTVATPGGTLVVTMLSR